MGGWGKWHGLLLGKQMPGGKQHQITELLANDDVVEAVIDPKSALLGPTTQRFKAEIDFDGRAITDRVLENTDLDELQARLATPTETRAALQDFGEAVVTALGVEIDRLESKIKEAVPEAEHVDLEAD